MMRPFANLDGLVRLSHNEGVDVRRPLLRVLTDLYVQEPSHTREEEQQYVELTLRLLPDVDTATRMVVARKLRSYPQAPAQIVNALLTTTPEAAELLGNIHTEKSPGEAIDADVRALDATAQNSTAISAPLQAKAGAPGPQAGADLASMQHDIGEAFLQMSAMDRARLLENLQATEADTEAEPIALAPRPGARKRLERAALQRNRNEFARELQLSLGITSRVAWRIAQDDSGELIVAAAKAIDMRVEMLVRVLLILNPAIGESVERVFSLTRLYERLLPEAVLPIVASWRDEAAARTAAQFRSLHADDGMDESGRTRDSARAARDEGLRRGRPARVSEAPLRRQDAS